MSNSIFDWPASLKRFVRFTTAKSEDVNDALDQLSAGLDTVEADIRRSLKLPTGTADQTLAMPSGMRAGLLLGFDANGNVTAIAGGGRYRGDWLTATAYATADYFRDPATKNIYAVVVAHTSTTVAADLAAGSIRLAIEVADVESQRALAQAAATTATTQADIATTKAAEAAQSALDATTQAELALTRANNADTARAAAVVAKDAAELAYDQFDDRYLGSKASPPTLDNDGNALTEGAMYWDSAIKRMCVWSGTEWQVTYDAAISIHAAPSKATPVDADELGLSDSDASWGLKKLTFANLKAWIGSFFVSKSGDTINGNLNFDGTGRRITGDFNNTTLSSRLIFQTSGVNNTTGVLAIPNGTGAVARFTASNASNPDNAGEFSIAATATAARLESALRGTGAYLPMMTYVGGFKNTEQPVAGGFLVTGGALGYGIGSGGTVTQATSKSTAVTLNKPSGQITMNDASLAAGAAVVFQVNNSTITAGDTVVPTVSGSNNYTVTSQGVVAGSFQLRVINASGGALAEAVVVNFSVIKGAAS